MLHPESSTTPRSNVIPFPNRNSARPAAPRARAKRQLLTGDQYAAARVLARIIAGGYGGTFRGCYYLTVTDDERACMREGLLNIASRLGLDPEGFIWGRRWCRRTREEWPVWPHEMFVACVKLLHQRCREGQPDELAERLVVALTADAERHEAAARSYRPEPESERERDGDRPTKTDSHQKKLKELRWRLEQLIECDDITDSSTRFRLEREIFDLEHAQVDNREDWPEYIDEGGAA